MILHIAWDCIASDILQKPFLCFYTVGWCLTSHSAIFQLYSDGTIVQFPNLDLLTGTQRYGQLGVFRVPSLPQIKHQDMRRRLLPPCHQRPTRSEGMPGFEHKSSYPQSSPLPLCQRSGCFYKVSLYTPSMAYVQSNLDKAKSQGNLKILWSSFWRGFKLSNFNNDNVVDNTEIHNKAK